MAQAAIVDYHDYFLWSVTKAGDFGLWNNACFAEQVVEA